MSCHMSASSRSRYGLVSIGAGTLGGAAATSEATRPAQRSNASGSWGPGGGAGPGRVAGGGDDRQAVGEKPLRGLLASAQRQDQAAQLRARQPHGAVVVVEVDRWPGENALGTGRQ